MRGDQGDRESIVNERGRVAVFMPTWRCRLWLPGAIDSVLAQTYPRIDLYVADDGGDDVDRDLLKRYPHVTFMRMWKRGGPYVIANLLLDITDSEFVGFHDADDWSEPTRFRLQVRFMAKHGLDGCGSWYRMLDTHGDPIGYATPPERASEALRQVLGDQMLHPTSLYRREVFDRLVGFDARTRFSADTEFHYRAALSHELGNLQRFLYHRRVRPTSLTQHPDTAIKSPAREAYMMALREAAEAAQSGHRPSPGTVLMGYPVRRTPRDAIEWIRPGRSNSTLRTGIAASLGERLRSEDA